jgi:opacity protein-like surface antigen
MNHMRHNRRRAPFILALATTMLLATAVQAAAAPKPVEEVLANGGKARLVFNEVGYTLQACDNDKDGYGVVAYVYTKGRRAAAFEAGDLNGAGTTCEDKRIRQPLGRDIVLRVVVKDHNNSEGNGKNHLKDDKSRRLRLA